jgi:hypothetical protein
MAAWGVTAVIRAVSLEPRWGMIVVRLASSRGPRHKRSRWPPQIAGAPNCQTRIRRAAQRFGAISRNGFNLLGFEKNGDANAARVRPCFCPSCQKYRHSRAQDHEPVRAQMRLPAKQTLCRRQMGPPDDNLTNCRSPPTVKLSLL